MTRFVLAGGHRHCTGADMESYWLPEHVHPFRQQIHFTGWLAPDELVAWYRAADILVVPSWYEPFGMVVLEGMLHGLAIAASAVGGPAEILEHERTGLLFPAKSTAALADTIARLALDAEVRGRIGTAAADEVRRYWLWPEIVVRMGRVYHEAAEEVRRPVSNRGICVAQIQHLRPVA
jgi:glycogen(starch) synthase